MKFSKCIKLYLNLDITKVVLFTKLFLIFQKDFSNVTFECISNEKLLQYHS